MKHVLIDETTLKRNPFYGQGYKRYAPGPVEITLRGGQMADAEMMKRFFAQELTDADIPEIQEIRREVVDVTCINEPEFIFEYKPMNVTCDRCQRTFSHDLLEDGWCYEFMPTDDGDICPFCGMSGCCEIEYETVTECLKRINKTINEIPYEKRDF